VLSYMERPSPQLAQGPGSPDAPTGSPSLEVLK
jgi:hypothetical protein